MKDDGYFFFQGYGKTLSYGKFTTLNFLKIRLFYQISRVLNYTVDLKSRVLIECNAKIIILSKNDVHLYRVNVE